MLLPDPLDLLPAPLFESVEDVHEQLTQHLQDLEVVLPDDHLEVQPGELAQMAAGVAVLRAKHGPHLEHPAEPPARRRHLFVELRGLRETRLPLEVLHLEDVAAPLGAAPDEFGRVHLHEVVFEEEFAEERPDVGLDPKDGLVGGRPEVDPAVVEAHLLPHPSPLRRRLLGLGVVRPHVGLGRLHPLGVLHLEGQVRGGAGDAPHLRQLDLHRGLGRRRDGEGRQRDDPGGVHHRLVRQHAQVRDHLGRDGPGGGGDGLHRAEAVAQQQERHFADHAARLDAGADHHDLPGASLGQVSHVGPDGVGQGGADDNGRVAERGGAAPRQFLGFGGRRLLPGGAVTRLGRLLLRLGGRLRGGFGGVLGRFLARGGRLLHRRLLLLGGGGGGGGDVVGARAGLKVVLGAQQGREEGLQLRFARAGGLGGADGGAGGDDGLREFRGGRHAAAAVDGTGGGDVGRRRLWRSGRCRWSWWGRRGDELEAPRLYFFDLVVVVGGCAGITKDRSPPAPHTNY
mmetsp:Transcript_25875/g.51548  ORF Transcript_25875/g.51548 Transcript_25875/m.51548 type:complete len:512 (-) Transcript_25875:61-1596(-)